MSSHMLMERILSDNFTRYHNDLNPYQYMERCFATIIVADRVHLQYTLLRPGHSRRNFCGLCFRSELVSLTVNFGSFPFRANFSEEAVSCENAKHFSE
jgi:hypothetical protein